MILTVNLLCNSRNAERIISTSISNPLGRDDYLKCSDDDGLTALTTVHTEGSFPPFISPFPAPSHGGVSLWGGSGQRSVMLSSNSILYRTVVPIPIRFSLAPLSVLLGPNAALKY
jgi:hypothetical protein